MDEFIAGQRNNLDQIKQIPYFRDLMGALDAAYRAAVDSLPPDGFPLMFGRVLLICRKSMLSAATLIAQGQPEDSVSITRRALEAARVALAIKLNDENAAQWLAYQERHDRWLKRQQNEKPRSFVPHYKDMRGDALIERIDTQLGIMSDAAVHFTPEFYSTLDWQVNRTVDGNGEVYLNYFQRDARDIERSFLSLGAAHTTILETLDRCYDGRFRQAENVWSKIATCLQLGRALNAVYHQEYRDAE